MNFGNSNYRAPPAVKYHGLNNQGATCYLNSVLQVLFMTEDFRDAVKRFIPENSDTDRIDHQLHSLFAELYKNQANTYDITTKLGINRVNQQRDAAEYFEKILRLTSEDASQIFHGTLTRRTKCLQCDEVDHADTLFWHLPLKLVDIYGEYNVVDGIKEHFQPSYFTGDNQIYCDHCDTKCDASMTCVVKHHPEVLMLLLKRFELDYYTMTFRKNNRAVSVPYHLQIPENQTYELYAFVEHFGELRCGHYTAAIQSPQDGAWYSFNDSCVTRISYQPFQTDIDERSQSAYLLFYRRTSAPPADTRSPPDIMAEESDEAAKTSENEEEAEAIDDAAVAAPINGDFKGTLSEQEVSREIQNNVENPEEVVYDPYPDQEFDRGGKNVDDGEKQRDEGKVEPERLEERQNANEERVDDRGERGKVDAAKNTTSKQIEILRGEEAMEGKRDEVGGEETESGGKEQNQGWKGFQDRQEIYDQEVQHRVGRDFKPSSYPEENQESGRRTGDLWSGSRRDSGAGRKPMLSKYDLVSPRCDRDVRGEDDKPREDQTRKQGSFHDYEEAQKADERMRKEKIRDSGRGESAGSKSPESLINILKKVEAIEGNRSKVGGKETDRGGKEENKDWKRFQDRQEIYDQEVQHQVRRDFRPSSYPEENQESGRRTGDLRSGSRRDSGAGRKPMLSKYDLVSPRCDLDVRGEDEETREDQTRQKADERMRKEKIRDSGRGESAGRKSTESSGEKRAECPLNIDVRLAGTGHGQGSYDLHPRPAAAGSEGEAGQRQDQEPNEDGKERKSKSGSLKVRIIEEEEKHTRDGVQKTRETTEILLETPHDKTKSWKLLCGTRKPKSKGKTDDLPANFRDLSIDKSSKKQGGKKRREHEEMQEPEAKIRKLNASPTEKRNKEKKKKVKIFSCWTKFLKKNPTSDSE